MFELLQNIEVSFFSDVWIAYFVEQIGRKAIQVSWYLSFDNVEVVINCLLKGPDFDFFILKGGQILDHLVDFVLFEKSGLADVAMVSFKAIFAAACVRVIAGWCDAELGDPLIMLAPTHETRTFLSNKDYY